MGLFDRTREPLTALEVSEVITRLDDIRMGFVPHSRAWMICNEAMLAFMQLFVEEREGCEVEHVGRSPEAEGRPQSY